MIDRKRRIRWHIAMIVFTVFTLSTVWISLATGYAAIPFQRVLPTLLGEGTFKETFVIFSLRLPRIIVTVLAGIALAVSGAILQGIARNDLADPGIIGINAGAGAAVAMFFLFFPLESTTLIYALPAVAFCGAFLTAVIIVAFSYRKIDGLAPIRFILVGFGFSIALSGLMVVLISSSERRKVHFIAEWLAGSIWGADWPFILAFLPWLIVFLPFTFFYAHTLNLLALREETAVSAGVFIRRARLFLLAAAVALAASAVSITGGISFIGLIAPHLAKTIAGPRAQMYLPLAALIGGWLLLTADTLGRNLLQPDGIPAGIMAAFIGAPYFIYLLVKST